jgi:urea transport system ATP-binding protein
MTGRPAITVDALRVSFGDFTAIDDVSLAIDYGEVRALIGPNGAGKTTLLDVVSGITKAAGGSVTLDGMLDLTGAGEATIARAGVRRKFQKPSVFDALSVRENLDVGLAGRLAGAEAVAEIERTLALVGLSAERDRPAGELAHGQKQWPA